MRIPARRLLAVSVAALLVVSGIAGGAASAQADVSTGLVTGTVLDTSNHPVVGAFLYASGTTGAGSTATSDTGTFSMSLPSGTYTITVSPLSGSADVAKSEDGVVVTASTTTTLNFSLEIGGTIAGAVSNSTGSPASGAAITVWNVNGSYGGGTTTSSNGSYSLAGLTTGNYVMRTTFTSQNLVGEWYDNSIPRAGAVPIAVTDGTTTAPKNVQLVSGAILSGTVKDSTDQALAKTKVTLYRWTGHWKKTGSVTTGTDGKYSFPALWTGDYTLFFSPPFTANALPTAWRGAALMANATHIPVVTAVNQTLPDMTLTAGASISGTAKNFGYVYAYSPNGDVARSAAIATDGTYSLVALAAGSYKLLFTPTYSSTAAYAWYSNAALKSAATTVTVATGRDRPGIDETSAVGGSITGTVTAPGAASAVNGSVTVVDADGNAVGVYSNTSFVSGSPFTVTNLAAGDYRLLFTPYSFSADGAYAPGWFGGGASLVSGTTVHVTASTAATANYELTPSAHIAGHVRGPGGEPITDADISVVGTGTFAPFSYASTDANGAFDAGGLSAGTYTLYVTENSGAYVSTSTGEGTTVVVTAGQHSTGNDITLAKFGQTTSPPSNNPPSNDPPSNKPPQQQSPAPVTTLTTAVATIDGTAAVGSTVTANPGVWGPAPVNLAFQWLRNGQPITGATSVKYTVSAADAATSLSVKVTGTKAAFTTATTTSLPLAVPPIVAASTPSIKGGVTVGTTLTAKVTVKKVKGAKVTYQWLVNGKKIKGATKAKYKLTSKDAGEKISVVVTTKKKGYTTLKVTSKATKKVAKKKK